MTEAAVIYAFILNVFAVERKIDVVVFFTKFLRDVHLSINIA
jgi:hypothetical protein